MMCPAAAGKIQCPIKPPSMGRGIHVPPEGGDEDVQELAYGSEDWPRVYHRIRNSIEAFNGFAKNDNHEAIAHAARPGDRQAVKTPDAERPDRWALGLPPAELGGGVSRPAKTPEIPHSSRRHVLNDVTPGRTRSEKREGPIP